MLAILLFFHLHTSLCTKVHSSVGVLWEPKYHPYVLFDKHCDCEKFAMHPVSLEAK